MVVVVGMAKVVVVTVMGMVMGMVMVMGMGMVLEAVVVVLRAHQRWSVLIHTFTTVSVLRAAAVSAARCTMRTAVG